MYCMKCGTEIPEDGQFCPACGSDVPRKVPPQPLMPAYPPAYPSPAAYQQPYTGYPPAPPGYQAYPAQMPYSPQMPQYYQGYQQPVMVVPLPNPLPQKPPMGQRIRERWEIYMRQAGDNRLETGLSITAACMVVIGALAMMITGL